MGKKGFYVQLHLHTSESSKCGKDTAADMIRACKAAGYDLVAVTDHFFNANINCDPDAPWPEKVEALFRGYHAAKAEGDKIGVEVIPGWETFTKGPELLTYGLDEAFLLAHPDIHELPYYDYIRVVTEAGGLIVHAHPYRKAHYIPDFTPDPRSVETYEVYNHHNSDPEFNRLAYKEAKEHGLLMIAGSDAHRSDQIDGGAMRFPYPVHSMHEILEAVKKGDGQIVETLPPIAALL